MRAPGRSTLGEIAGALVATYGGELIGPADQVVEGLAPLDSAAAGDLSFLSNPKYRAQLAPSRAGCVVVAPTLRDEAVARGACIVAPDPYRYFAAVTRLWKAREALDDDPRVHPSAIIDPAATVHETARIGPLCVVERGARVGEGTVLAARVNIGARCVVGARCLLHPGVVVGADGFGFAPHAGRYEKVEQLGAVVVGDDVEIGANTCIDRGALADTVIEEGVKLDNLIQIGHNVRIGRHTAMAAMSGVAGSTTIGAHCMIGGQAGIDGHLTIADGTYIKATTLVTRSITKPGVYSGGFPFDDNAAWEKNAATIRQLYRLRERVRALEAKLGEAET